MDIKGGMSSFSETEKLVRECQKGITGSFEKLYSFFYGTQYFQAYRIVRDRFYAEDITQEVFIHVYGEIKSLKEAALFPKWLKTITYRLCMDHIRRHEKQEVLTENLCRRCREEKAGLEKSVMPGPEEAAEMKFRSREVSEKILELPGEMRNVLLMKYACGFREKEIAALSGIPLGTVKSRLHYGRKILKRKLKDLR